MQEVNINEAFEAYKPYGCALVISIDENGKPSGMTNAWHMKCSREPALLAISMMKTGYTHELIRQSKEFVLAVANKELEKEVRFFGSTHGNVVDKFKETGIETEPAKFIKSPLVKKATVNFECVVEREVDAGDHIIFIGKILNSYVNPGKKVLLSFGKVGDQRVFEEL